MQAKLVGKEKVWHLGILGVDPDFHGQGKLFFPFFSLSFQYSNWAPFHSFFARRSPFSKRRAKKVSKKDYRKVSEKS
jgi:hypothetical protein